MVGVVGLAGLIAWTAVGPRLRHGRAARRAGRRGRLRDPDAGLVDPRRPGPSQPDHGHRLAKPPRPRQETLDISIAKIAGLWGIWAVIGALYCIARWYWDGAYLFAMQVLAVGVVPMLVLSIPYVLWLDRRLVEPRDGAWHFGQMLIGRPELVDRDAAPRFLPRLGGQGLLPRLHDLDRAGQLGRIPIRAGIELDRRRTRPISRAG